MNSISISPFFAVGIHSHALSFAWKHLTQEGLITIFALLIVSIFSWTVIVTKARQLIRARRMGKKFFQAYRETRDPLELARHGKEFDGAPAYELYNVGAEETEYQLKNNPVHVVRVQSVAGSSGPNATGTETDVLARQITTKISKTSFESVQVSLERAASEQALALEKGMIILSTAVAGGPFLGLFGTVWGVMETFSGIGIANAASLNAMAPGVAAALLATVAGLSVAIPAMFAYNYMVTSIRAITQELDGFASEYATALEHKYVDSRPLAEEIRTSLQEMYRATPREAAQPLPRPAASPQKSASPVASRDGVLAEPVRA
jgi:biopolymer transport protein TolQ